MLLPLHLNLWQGTQYGGSGGRENAKLVFAWMQLPKRPKREDILPVVIETIEAIAENAAVDIRQPVAEVAEKILDMKSASQLAKINTLEKAVALVEQAIIEMDDEDAILLALH